MRMRNVRDAKFKKYIDDQDELQNPPPISEEDINKGMISLLNRGIIPKDVDLTPAFEKGAPPVQFKSMKFHEKQEQYARTEVHTEKFSKNAVKFDLQPIQEVLPRQLALMPSSMALVPVDSQHGSSPQKAIMG